MKHAETPLLKVSQVLCICIVILVGITVGVQHPACAASGGANILFILDGSGSMWGRLDNVEKIVIAKDTMSDLVQNLPDSFTLGLMVYGHRRKGDCEDIELLSPVGQSDAAAIVKQIQSVSPKGKTPITKSIILAGQQLEAIEEETTIVLVSDGEETCEGDPCEYVRTLKEKGIDFTMHVVGFDVNEEQKAQLSCIAEAGGGQYFSAQNAVQLKEAFMEVKKEVVKKVEPPLPSPCDDPNRILNTQNGHCYQNFDIPMTWHAAKAYCENLGGYLATLTSRAEMDFVYHKFKDKKHFLWLGGTDEAKEGSWKWITGERWTYTDWPEGLPDNCVHVVSPCKPENYLHIVLIDYDFLKGGKWNDTYDTAYEDWGTYGQHNNLPLCEWEGKVGFKTKPNKEAEIQAVRDVIDAEIKGTIAQDLGLLQSIWASDGVIKDFSARKIHRGWEKIYVRYKEMFSVGTEPYTLSELSIKITDDIVTVTHKGGIVNGKYYPDNGTYCLRKADNRWGWEITKLQYGSTKNFGVCP